MQSSTGWMASRFVGLVRFCCVALGSAGAGLAADDLGVRVPEGFEVVEFAGDELAHDIYSMTIDSQGRVVVAGAGYVKILIDRDGDGKADEAKLFSDSPRNGAQGMFFHGRSLLCVGDAGLLRYRDANGDDQADGPPDVFLKTKTGGEHDVHSIQHGPDGWWYVIAGNGAGITSKYATLASSPIRQPRAGVIFRLKPDLSGGEILSHGLRNAYDFAFNGQGDLFTYDSDEEREVSLPWYRPTRVTHSLTGADHGWVSKSWMRPDGYSDMPPTVASFGRGSPTGVICYRHTQFPDKYRDALFVLDWTYGRVHLLPLKPAADTWSTEPELFMSGTGQNGFAPTDAEVGPDGSLYVSIGGRGTRGGVYRIRHTLGAKLVTAKSVSPSDSVDAKVGSVLEAPQPLSSWSRAKWVPLAKELRVAPFQKAALDEKQPTANRIRAIEVLAELFNGIDAATMKRLAVSPSSEVRARAIWAYGRTSLAQLDPEIVKQFLDDKEPLVGRCALELCLSRSPQSLEWSPLLPSLAKRLGGSDRFNRTLAGGVVARFDEQQMAAISAEATKAGVRAVVTYAAGWLGRNSDETARIRSVVPSLAIAVLKKKENTVDLKLDAVRLLQRALGDMGPSARHAPVFDGYASGIDLDPFERELDPLRVQLAEIYPTGDAKLDRELIRLLAMLTSYNSKLVDAVCDKLTEESDPLDDLHHLVAIARLPMTHSVKQRDALVKSLVNLEAKVAARKLPQDASWSDRVKEAWVALALADDFLASALVGHPAFGRPGHTVFLNQMPPQLLSVARAAFAKQIATDSDYAWTNEVIFALADSDEAAHHELIRAQFDRFTVRGGVLVILSRNPVPTDRAKFVAGLDWSQTEVLSACLSALEKLGPGHQPDEQLALLKSLRRLGADEREYAAREIVVSLLERNNGQRFPFVTGKPGHRPQPETIAKWTALCQQKWPTETAAQLGGNDAEFSKLKTMLSEVNWNAGNAARGAELYTKRSCAQCHGAKGALGPDLMGAASRFSKEDLFTAILLPSRDVPARYQTTIVQTKEGQTYSGLIVYESVDGFLIRNGTGQTFRVETHQIDERRKSPVSVMPMGLLKDFTAADYADLFAHLQTLNIAKTAASDVGKGE
ncbi:MAG: PVC-type heme-binding CxxCH protein [Planctomycetota bacterium]